MTKLPDPQTTRGLVIWSLLFLLFVESVWAINYLSATGSTQTTTQSVQASTQTDQADALLPPQTADPDATASLSLSFDDKNPKVGDVFSIIVKLDTDNKPVDGASVKIDFDPTLVEVVGKEPAVINPAFPVVLTNKVEGTMILVSAVANPTGPFFSGTETIATIKLKAKQAGPAIFKINFSPKVTTDSNVVWHDKAGQDILGRVENLTVGIEK